MDTLIPKIKQRLWCSQGVLNLVQPQFAYTLPFSSRASANHSGILDSKNTSVRKLCVYMLLHAGV